MTEGVASELERLRASARERIQSAADPKTLEALRVSLLGKKGELTTILRQLGSLPTAERAAAGTDANQLKDDIFRWIAERMGGVRTPISSKTTFSGGSPSAWVAWKPSVTAPWERPSGST